MLSLAFLGSPVVERDGSAVSFDTRKAVGLLALLAVTGREQSRERVAALLWPDSDSARARGSLRRTLSVTAAAVGDELAITRMAVALRPGLARVDVADFETLASQADLASLARAARLYRDDFLAGFSMRGCDEFEDWRADTADRLRQALAGALERLSAGLAAAGDHDTALVHARRWLSLDPLHEPAHQAMIRLLALAGQRSAAVRQYRALVRVLDAELAVRPLPETTQLYDDVRAGRLAPPQPARLSDAAPAAGLDGARAAGVDVAVVAGPGGTAAAGGSSYGTGQASLAAWPVAGRAAELAAFTAAWHAMGEAAAEPHGRLIAVVGDAGSGKTRLVEEFRAAVAAGAGAVVAGRSHDGEAGLPYALTIDLLRSALRACPELPGRLPAPVAADVGRLVPELTAAHTGEPTPPLSGPLALTRMYGAVGATLLAAAGPGQSALVIAEDIGWADGPSLELLAYLARRPATWPALLVTTWRPQHARRLRGLEEALAEAAAAGLGWRLEPKPLTAAEIAELLAAAGLSGTDPARMLAETRGHPLLVREYAEALRAADLPATGQAAVTPGAALAPGGGGAVSLAGAAGDLPGDGGRWEPPEPVRALLTQRLRAARERARQMVTTAAVLGSGSDAELLRAVSGRGEAETLEALDEAVARFLLTELAAPDGHGPPSYDFPYEALRRVAYESASIARRRLLHGRAATALAARYERDPRSVRAAAVAEHLTRAGQDTEAAAWWWRAAVRSRELYAHEDALAQLRQALALGQPRQEVSVALGDVLTVLGRYREALAEYEAAAASVDGDGTALAAIEHKLAEVRHRLGEWELAAAHLEAAVEALPAASLAARARVIADQAVVACRRGDVAGAAALGEQALAAAQRAGDEAAMAQALNVLGMVSAREGDQAGAERHLRESMAHARELPDRSVAVAALNNLARLLADAGDLAGALPLAEEALALGSELGDSHRVAALHTNLADLLHAAGQRDAALRHLKESARRFAALDTGGGVRPEVWTLVEW